MTDEGRAWIRTLPLLLVAAVLLIGGAFTFHQQGANDLSISTAAVGVFLLGCWAATAVADWAKAHRRTHGGTDEPR